ncbi:MAG: hydrogenase formation protein HypD [Thermodesulfobacteriota bacterium]
MKHAAEYRDKQVSASLIQRINGELTSPLRLMEVCGTHTVAIFRSGIRSVLPRDITLLSGPGCPVCVTAQAEIDAFVSLAAQPDVIITTFGDLMRVPGSGSSLQQERAGGKDIRIVYSTFDALTVARENPGRPVVFLGVGFETTAPTVAAAILAARESGLDNFSVFCAHKTVPAALCALMETRGVRIDGFLLPGHVSVIIGADAYRSFVKQYGVPCVVAGFEPADILQAIWLLVRQIGSGEEARVENAYPRAVTAAGNPKARAVMDRVFEPADADWRGIGVIPLSGLRIRPLFERHDARLRFGIHLSAAAPPKGCACGEILTGLKIPPDCALYETVCTPMTPVGPCMVSSEGTCAAYYKYRA